MEKLIKSKNGQWSLTKAKDSSGDNDNNEMLMSQLKQIVHHVKELNSNIDRSGNEPDWVNAKITEAAKALSDVAHYIDGLKDVKKTEEMKKNMNDDMEKEIRRLQANKDAAGNFIRPRVKPGKANRFMHGGVQGWNLFDERVDEKMQGKKPKKESTDKAKSIQQPNTKPKIVIRRKKPSTTEE